MYIIPIDEINVTSTQDWITLLSYIMFCITIMISMYHLNKCDNDLDNECDNDCDINIVKNKIRYEDKYVDEYRRLVNIDKVDNTLTPETLVNLKNNFIFHQTPVGNAVIFFNYNKDDPELSSFVYYSDHTMPYNYLNTLARKYVITFNCLKLYIDNNCEKENECEKDNASVIEEPVEMKENILSNKKDVFVNLKSYNKETIKDIIKKKVGSNEIEHNTLIKDTMNIIPPKKINRYTSGGKISNFNFIKNKNKKSSLSFSEFKKMKLL